MQEQFHNDISHLTTQNGKEIFLIGTAHISEESRLLVRETIEKENPDAVCIELDEGRLQSLDEPERWKKTDLKTVIKEKQLGTLVANLILGSYQKRMGAQTGVKPGAELYEAVLAAREKNIPIVLSDRNIKLTLKRAWASTPWYRKFSLLGGLFASLFDKSEISEKELQKMKEQDTLNTLMQEFGKTYPEIKQVLIHERDLFLASSINDAEGKKIVAVVGAGHKKGICEIIENGKTVSDKTPLEIIPPKSLFSKVVGWAIPIAIVTSLIALGVHAGIEKAGEAGLYWAMLTGGGAMLGTIVAGGHPLTILTALVAAPFTGLTPLIGVGFFTALVQVYMRPPRVKEMETLTEDIWHFKLWWKNRALRVFLCFLLPGFPAIIGKILAIFNIYQSF